MGNMVSPNPQEDIWYGRRQVTVSPSNYITYRINSSMSGYSCDICNFNKSTGKIINVTALLAKKTI